MNRIVSILLCIGLLLQTFTCVSVLTAYQLHQEIITRYFCVNQDRPQLDCKGKCFLKKQIEKSKESSQRNTGQEDVVHLFFVPASPIAIAAAAVCELDAFCPYPEKTYSAPLFAAFHPPRG